MDNTCSASFLNRFCPNQVHVARRGAMKFLTERIAALLPLSHITITRLAIHVPLLYTIHEEHDGFPKKSLRRSTLDTEHIRVINSFVCLY